MQIRLIGGKNRGFRMRKREFNRLYPRYRRIIQAIARKFAKQDDELCADLEQEGVLCLLRINLGNATKNPDAFLRMAIRNSMIDYLRRQNPQIYESLDYRIECGDQVERRSSGDLALLSDRPNSPKLFHAEDDDGT